MRLNVRTAVAALSLALIVLANALSPAGADSRAMRLPVQTVKLVAETAAGERSFSIEVADEPSEQERGLMFREDMPDDRGMLFDLGTTRQASFWMENTPMPLDLLFIGEDGRVRAILPGQPFSRAAISPGVPVRFVLELKQGTSVKNGIAPGDRLRHPVIDAVAGSN
jgi:uncharacterized membrane protein (UPF0127 family)